MSTDLDLKREVGEYFNLAQRLVTETEGLLKPGRTIAQSPDAFEALRAAADDVQMCGGTGWVFVFGDRSAVMTSNAADMIWPRWVV
jgi:hypothetical protein